MQYTADVLAAPDNELVCWCAKVTAGQIRTAIASGAHTLDAVRTAAGACIKGNCKENNPRGRCCSVEIMKLLASEVSGKTDASAVCGCCAGKP